MMQRIAAKWILLGGASLAPLSALAAPQPVSVSYEKVVECFPELKDESISFKVDLNRLKEVIDDRFVTSRSLLRQRKVHYLDTNGQLRNLILRNQPVGVKKLKTELILQIVNEKGVVTDVKLTENQRINPPQEVLNGFLAGSTVKSDEYSYLDTKLNGVTLAYRRDFKVIEELELKDRLKKRSVLCEKQKDLGIICTCSQK